VTISEGATSDLIVTSQNIGARKATVISETALVLDQQAIMLNSGGTAFSANLEGQGLATGGVLNVSGTLSTGSGSRSFTIAGARRWRATASGRAGRRLPRRRRSRRRSAARWP
jgi:hypothetical protein